MSYRGDFLLAYQKMRKLFQVVCATMEALSPEAFAALTSDSMKRKVCVWGPSAASPYFFKAVHEAPDYGMFEQRLLTLKEDVSSVLKPYLDGMCQSDIIDLKKAAVNKNWCIFRDDTAKVKPFKYYVHHGSEFIAYGTLEDLLEPCANTPLSGIIRYNVANIAAHLVRAMLRFIKSTDVDTMMYGFVSLLIRR